MKNLVIATETEANEVELITEPNNQWGQTELTRVSRTVKLSTIVQPLHLIRGTVTHRLMNAIAIIKALDVIKYR